MCDSTNRYSLLVALGKIEGLAGTIRYDLPDDCRQELREIAQSLGSLDSAVTTSTNCR